MHCCKCVSFWGTSYSRPPTHTSLPPLLLNPGGATVWNYTKSSLQFKKKSIVSFIIIFGTPSFPIAWCACDVSRYTAATAVRFGMRSNRASPIPARSVHQYRSSAIDYRSSSSSADDTEAAAGWAGWAMQRPTVVGSARIPMRLSIDRATVVDRLTVCVALYWAGFLLTIRSDRSIDR